MKCINMFGIIVLAWNLFAIDCAYTNRRQFVHGGISEENNDNPDTSRYKFAYGVEDHKTGDFKMHQEERDGDLVKGEYTVGEADGTFRTVRYTADKLNGFHAVISKNGDAQQQVPAPSHHRPVKVPPTSAPIATTSGHHHRHHGDRESMRFAETAAIAAAATTHHPVRKYMRAPPPPQFAKTYATKPNRVVESFAAENAAHYQSVDIDNSAERTHYEYTVPQDARKEEKSREERVQNARHVEMYGRRPVFHMQVPHGFRKNEEGRSVMAVALPLISHHAHREDVEEDDDDDDVDDDDDRHGQGQRNAPASEENDWKIGQGRNEPTNNYRQIFETHFGKYRRPSKDNDHGAFSYMNYEGESKNGYELQHGVQSAPKPKYVLSRY